MLLSLWRGGSVEPLHDDNDNDTGCVPASLSLSLCAVCPSLLRGALCGCDCHWAAVLGPHGRRSVAALCIGVVIMGGRREECTRVIVVLHGLCVGIVIVVQWPCGHVVVVVQGHCDRAVVAQQLWVCVDVVARGQCAPLVGADLALIVMRALHTGSVVASSPRGGSAKRWRDHANLLSGPQGV